MSAFTLAPTPPRLVSIRSAHLTPQKPRWIGATGLISLVRETVQSIPWPGKSGSFHLRVGNSYPASGLMGLISFCYCAGIYGSRDIEKMVARTPKLAGAFETPVPDWKTIRRFRRIHRATLHECLSSVLNKALLIRFGDPNCEPILPDCHVAEAIDRWFDPLCLPCPATDAAQRIERALAADELILS